MENKKQEVAIKEEFQGATAMQQAEFAAIQVAASAKAEVESAFIIALKRPRNRYQCRTEILESCKSLLFAEKAKYKKPVGKKKEGSAWIPNFVEGPSIRFAEEMIRSWGNIKVQHFTIYEDDTKRISKVNVIDLEKNISYSKQLTVEKSVERKSAYNREVIAERVNSQSEVVFIVRATDDEIHNKEAALVSKEIRNASLRMIPQDIIEESMQLVEKTIKSGVSVDPKAVRKQITDSFAGIGISPTDLEKYLGHELDKITPKEVADLKSVYMTIKDGQATWQEYLSDEPPSLAAETAKIPDDNTFQAGDPSTHQDVKESPGKGKK